MAPGVAAKREVKEWVLIDLSVASKVSGIVTQGRGDISEWVTHFMVSYSLDAYKWEFARDIYGTKKVQAVLSLITSYLVSALYYQRQWIRINKPLVAKKCWKWGGVAWSFTYALRSNAVANC